MTAVQEERTTDDLKALAERAGRELEDATALEILQWAAKTFGDRFCVTSSMEDAVVAHLASRALPGVDVVFLDTGYHFPETIGTRDAVEAVMDVNVITLTPRQTVAEQDAEYGPKLHDRDPDLCCALRKVRPLEEGLKGYQAWATGLRRDESETRANTPVVGWDEKAGQGEDLAHRQVVTGRCANVRHRARRPHQPVADGRLCLRRLRALHPSCAGGRGRPRRTLGGPLQDRVRTARLT
ncbi:phosphoadenosine phosphosulfate reductase [Streptomyces sp. SAI-163]